MTTLESRCLAIMELAFKKANSYRCNIEMIVEESDLSLKEFYYKKNLYRIVESTYIRVMDDPVLKDFLCFSCIRKSHSKGYEDEIKDYYVRVDRDLNSGRDQDKYWKFAIGQCQNVPRGEARVLAALKYLQEMTESDREKLQMLIDVKAL